MTTTLELPRLEIESRIRTQNVPDLFLVGAPKTGTTALSKYLSAHPAIYMARKEMHFFGRDLHFGRAFFRRNREEYLAEFAPRGDAYRAGESSVWYLYSSQAAQEIKDFSPDASIIIMLREPAELLYSLYHQFRFDGSEQLPTFEQALAAEEKRRAGRGFCRQAYFRQGLIYHDAVRFTDQIRRYFRIFGRDCVHVIIYDDFAADPAGTYNKALDFLGLDPLPWKQELPVINGNKQVRNGLLRAALNEPLLHSTVLAARHWLPRGFFLCLQRTYDRLLGANARPVKRPPMPAHLRARLKKQFEPEVERLSRLLGRDLSYWSK
jgi:hypothetical protein